MLLKEISLLFHKAGRKQSGIFRIFLRLLYKSVSHKNVVTGVDS